MQVDHSVCLCCVTTAQLPVWSHHQLKPWALRMQTDWTSANLTIATRLMMRHALRDPHALYFLTLSDTGVRLSLTIPGATLVSVWL